MNAYSIASKVIRWIITLVLGASLAATLVNGGNVPWFVAGGAVLAAGVIGRGLVKKGRGDRT